MTQVDSAEPAAVETPAPVPTETPSVPVAAPPVDDGYIRVPKDQIANWDGRFGEVVKRAKAYDENAEWYGIIDELKAMDLDTGEKFRAYWQQRHAESEPAAAPQEPGNPDEKPLTVAQFKKFQEEQTQKQRQDREQDEQTRTTQEARAAEQTASDGILDGLKLKADSRQRLLAKHHLNGCLNDKIEARVRESMPLHATDAQVQAAISKALDSPGTEADLESAQKAFLDDWKDFDNEAVAQFATQQNATTTLGAGPGGPQPPLDTSQMDPDDWRSMSRKDKADMAKAAYLKVRPDARE